MERKAASEGAHAEQKPDVSSGQASASNGTRPAKQHLSEAATDRSREHHRHVAQGTSSSSSSKHSSRAPSRPSSSHGTEQRHAPGIVGGGRSSRHHGPSKAPVRIGQYTLMQTLGTGSFGKVKLATHSLTGHRVAMKFINRRKISTMDMGGRVKREIQYLKLLRHPHIIKLYEVITTPSDIIMVIEYAGGELFQYIVDKGRMPEDEARRFFQQIICAIEYCHRHKIVHRDLKPENLLLDDHLNVKIGDFGLSNIMTDGDFLKTSCGSPNYAAPEVISGKLYAGPEIDIWSCGVILYVMLCGRLPFDDDYIPTLFKKINGGIYTLPSYLSAEAKHLLSSMLIVDPVKRITITEIRQLPWFQKDLAPYLQPLPPTPAAEPDGFNFAPAISEDAGTNRDTHTEKTTPHVIAPEIGVVEDDIVNELTEKMVGFTHEDVRHQLLEAGPNQVRVAYQLLRDHKRMLQFANMNNSEDMASFLAQSPPPWNAGMDDMVARSTSIRRKEKRPASDHPSMPTTGLPAPAEAIGDETIFSEQDIGNVTDEMTTEAGQSDEEDSATDFDDLFLEDDDDDETSSKPVGVALLAPSLPALKGNAETPSSENAPQAASSNVIPARRARSRWHFGIRSRSPPMEIMLELYRTLQVLGMEWREKPFDKKTSRHSDNEEGADERSIKKDKDEPLLPRGEELYFIETRWAVQSVIVRMNLQLYRVDEGNYLVDFRYVGCQMIEGASLLDEDARPSSSASDNNMEQDAYTSPPAAAHGATGSSSAEQSSQVPSAAPSDAGPTPLDTQSLHTALETAYKQSGQMDRPGSASSTHPQSSLSAPKAPQKKTSLKAAPVDGNIDVCSPFLFLECATRLIIELAGGG